MKESSKEHPTQLVRVLRAHDIAEPEIATYEYHLLTDVIVYGSAPHVGPLSFVNTLIHAGTDSVSGLRPSIVLRISYRKSETSVVRFDDNYKHYSGGDLTDEIAAMCTLLLGVRVVAGSLKREFLPELGPFGLPTEYRTKLTPFFQANYGRLRVPRAHVDVNISAFQMIVRLALLPNSISTGLVKAARLYQQALMLCESLPEMAWLLLVSALETVAAEHAFRTGDKITVFRQSHPEVAKRLGEHGEVEADLAEYFFGLSRSRVKFSTFIKTFMPAPPAKRPPPAFCFDMSEPSLESAISAIYKHRSTHLHGGTAFPAPMCEPPRYWTFPDHPAEGYQEKPMGHGANYSGASWSAATCPMLLHQFEYIARGCILEWWTSNDSQIAVDCDDRDPKITTAQRT